MPQRRSRLERPAIGFALLLAAIGASRGGRGSAEPAERALPIGPAFPVGGPTSAAWREEMLTKVKELSGLASWIYANAGDADRPGQLAGAIADHLNAAQATAAGKDRTGRERLNLWKRFKSSSGGSSFERALGNSTRWRPIFCAWLRSPTYAASFRASRHTSTATSRRTIRGENASKR
jgi:hypothetical protein